jgi:Tfp pilus assembly protein PilE
MDRVTSGYTLSQLLIVIFFICVILALVFPAIQASRETTRRAQCNNNLKNISLGLLNYHDTYRRRVDGRRHGPRRRLDIRNRASRPHAAG